MTFTAILTGSRLLYQERFKHRLSALPITYDLQTVGCLLQQGSERIIIDLLSGRNFDGFSFRRSFKQRFRPIQAIRIENRKAHGALRDADHSCIFSVFQKMGLLY